MPAVIDTPGGPAKRPKKSGNPVTAAERRRQREAEALARGQVAETERTAKASPQQQSTNHAEAAKLRAARTHNQAQLQDRKGKAEIAARNRAVAKGKPSTGSSNTSGPSKPSVGSSNGGGKSAGRGHGGGKHGGKGAGKGSGAGNGGRQNGSTGISTSAYSKGITGRAQNAVDLMLNPKLAALGRQADDIQSEYTTQKGDLETQTQRQLGDLAVTYKQLDNMLGANSNLSAQAFVDAGNNQDAAFKLAQDRLAASNQQTQTGVDAELNRLGITGANQSQLQADAAFQQQALQGQQAQSDATMQLLAANAGQFNTATRNSQAAMGTQAQTVARQSAVDMLNNLLAERNKGVHGINSQVTEVKGQRGSLIQQMIDQYEQQAYERQAEAAQQSFANQMGVNNFNLDVDQFNADNAYKQAQLALDGQKLTQQQNDPAKAPKNGGFGTGFKGAQAYFGQNMTDAGRKAALTAIMQKVDTHAQNANRPIDDFSQNSPTDIGKALNYAYSILRQPGFRHYLGPKSKTLLKAAMDVYFGKY